MKKYPKTLIILHWITFALIVLLFIMGFRMEEYPFDEANFNRYRAHALTGMLVLFLTIIRIIIKRKNKDNLPPDIEYYSEGHKVLVKTVEKLMYILLILAPITGFIMVYQTGALQYDLGGPFPEGAEFSETWEEIHKTLVFILGGLIIMHIAGVIIYKIKTGENLIKRMCLLLK